MPDFFAHHVAVETTLPVHRTARGPTLQTCDECLEPANPAWTDCNGLTYCRAHVPADVRRPANSEKNNAHCP
jgi:hypothetical protein